MGKTRDLVKKIRDTRGTFHAKMGALSVAVCAWDLLKEVTIIFITSTIVWAR